MITKPPAGSKLAVNHPLTPSAAILFTNDRILVAGEEYALSRSESIIYGPNTTFFTGTAASLSESRIIIPTAGASMHIRFRKTDSTLRDNFLFRNTDSGTTANRMSAHAPWSDSNIYFDFGGVASPNRLTLASSAAEFSIFRVWSFCAGAAGMQIYKDGVRIANSATGVTRANGTPGLSFGGDAGTDLIELDYAYYYGRQLRENDIAWLNAEPYAFIQAPAPYREYFTPPLIAATNVYGWEPSYPDLIIGGASVVSI